MQTFSALLAFCAGSSPVTGEFPAQRPVTRSFNVFFDLRLDSWANNEDAGDLRRHRAHYDIIVMDLRNSICDGFHIHHIAWKASRCNTMEYEHNVSGILLLWYFLYSL